MVDTASNSEEINPYIVQQEWLSGLSEAARAIAIALDDEYRSGRMYGDYEGQLYVELFTATYRYLAENPGADGFAYFKQLWIELGVKTTVDHFPELYWNITVKTSNFISTWFERRIREEFNIK